MHELCRLRRSEGMQSATRFLPERSGFVRKRRSDGMHELCRLRRSEGMQSATTWGRTGFDGDAEIGIAGGCAYHP